MRFPDNKAKKILCSGGKRKIPTHIFQSLMSFEVCDGKCFSQTLTIFKNAELYSSVILYRINFKCLQIAFLSVGSEIF
jgi:hypothetical protein